MSLSMYALVVLCLFAAFHDLNHRRVPNAITLPLLSYGLVVNFPAAPAVWLGSLLLLSAWGSGWMGGGDAKLWLGLLWCTFPLRGEAVTFVMCLALISTGLAQVLARLLGRKKEVVGIKLPGAWRALVYVLLLALTPAA